MRRKRALVVVISSLLVLASTRSAALADPLGPLGAKADAYDTWYRDHHTPGYGGNVDLFTETPSDFNVVAYVNYGDSTGYTGEYLASQAFRYAATGDPVAKANAVRSATALHHHLAATDYTKAAEVAPGREGTAYIARYVAPDTPPFNVHPFPWESQTCDLVDDCHLIESGPYAGSWWRGDTSRDMYIGYFFGNYIAYDLVDDPDMRAMIAADVRRVIDQLRADQWRIIERDGRVTGAGMVQSSMRMAWLLVAAHVTGDPVYAQAYAKDAWVWALVNTLEAIHVFNLYTQYYAFSNAVEIYYPLLRLEPDPGRRQFTFDIYEDRLVALTANTHNVYFDYIWMALRGAPDPATVADDAASLALFNDAPNRHETVYLPEMPLDPLSVTLHNLNLWLKQLIPGIPIWFDERTIAPRPVDERCPAGWLWSHSPYEVTCDVWNERERTVNAGADYLTAYWMGRYYGYLGAGD